MSQFTLLVPTRDRPALLQRLLHYYENESFQNFIVVADSSDTTAFEENRKTMSRCRACKVVHRGFDSSIEFFEKVVNALKTVDTPYVGLCADDDFIASHSVDRSVEFLTKHPSYNAVQGRSFTVEISNNQKLHVVAYPQHAVEGADAKTRFESYFKNPSPNFYAVYRTAVIKDIFARISRYRTDNTRFEELAVSSLAAVSGNIAVLPTLHMVRQTSRNRTDSGSKQTGGWRTIVQLDSFTKNRQIFIAMLSEALRKHGMDSHSAEQVVVRCFDTYLAQALGTIKRPQRISILERAIAATLSPTSPHSTFRRLGAYALLRLSPRLQTLHVEFSTTASLIEKYPDGIKEPLV